MSILFLDSAEANTLATCFEEIILNGKSIKAIEINEWSGIRIKRLGSQELVLVSDYSTYEPEETVVRFSSKELLDKTLVDAETGEKIEPVSGVYSVKIKADRARLFHFGSGMIDPYLYRCKALV